MWLNLATYDVKEEQYREARESAARAESVVRLVAPDSTYALAEAILLGAVARLAPYPRTAEDIRAARDGFDRAIRLFPPQKDLDSFDPLLAKLLAWDMAAGSLGETLGIEGDRDDESTASPPRPPLFEYQQDASVECADVEWVERHAPAYPTRALREGMNGAVFLGYRLDEDLKVKDARVLAEVPVAKFGEMAVRALAEWQAKAMPSGDPVCYRNLTTSILFVIER
jgi:TonB family protein